ncbi:MAG TPA: SDR family NAD(P)-dependent oxidoreductase, partial [Azospirillum sp.]
DAADGIAVIGMSGQFPGARTVEEFWRNMMEGVDPVVELPAHYLDPRSYSPEKQPGKSYCKWGGVLEGRDCFDPLFFNISPREAESMNPHQRLILQESWRALEDAGYNPKSFKGSRTGIFVGCEPSAYVHETFTGASDAIVASRLSYHLDLKGPAFVVNTGCSSSGVALHLACESLRRRESDVALAGGAFAVMGQTILVGLAQTEMLTRGGRCRSFDADADGMVMSEGVGMVALKRLDQALADGDAVYAVIRASGINQDGASNGITAPSGTAQQELIVDVYRRYGIDPERISYVETHGTGTKLGDPVEANALVRAFRQFTGRTHYCAVGSAKSHIGHTSGNAGVTGLITILLCLKHHRLPPLKHFQRLNPLIEFDGSPFYPNTALAEWRSADGRPLMAALNSFGHSGTNVHLVIEEFVDTRPAADTGQPELIVLSAKDEARLAEAAGNLREFVRRAAEAGEAPSLADIAHTLRTGRDAMEQRIAFVAGSLAELDDALTALLDGGAVPGPAFPGGVWRGYVEPRPNRKAGATPETASRADIAGWLAERALDALAAAWVKGAAIDWAGLSGASVPRRIHLPTYPFARERYWRPADAPRPAPAPAEPATAPGREVRRRFTGEEFFFADHRVQGRRILPGVACLELARDAAAQALGPAAGPGVRLENIVWTVPLAADGGIEVAIQFDAPRDGAFPYRLCSVTADGRTQPHHQGVFRPGAAAASDILDLSALRAGLDGAVPADACYAALEAAGVQHGPALRALRAVHTGRGQALARLELPPAVAGNYALHPAILDAAWQATIALALDGGAESGGAAEPRPALLPFALESLDVAGPCEPAMWAWIRPGAESARPALQKLDIDLCTEGGEVRVRMRGLTSRVVPAAPAAGDDASVTRLDGTEYFLRDHGGMVPAMVYVDMARAAAARRGIPVAGLSHVVWPQPMTVGAGGGELTTRLTRDGGDVAFVMASGAGVHCQGQVVTGAPDEAAVQAVRDLAAVRARCPSRLDREACDALLRHTHGPSLLSIDHLCHGADEALALLVLPAGLPAEGEASDLHPSLLNGALLASVVWSLTGRPDAALPMPFSLERLRIHAALPARLYAHVRRHAAPSGNREVVDIDLLDLEGRRLASLERLTTAFAARDELLFAVPGWVDRQPGAPAGTGTTAAALVILAEPREALRDALRARCPAASVEVLPGASAEEDFLWLLARCQRLLTDPAAGVRPLLLAVPDGPGAFRHAGLTGLLKTVRLEQPRIAAKAVLLPGAGIDDGTTAGWLATELQALDGDAEVRYGADGRRQVRSWAEICLPDAGAGAGLFAPGDVVWITGGLGGIGRLVARHLGVSRGARLVLGGRSAPDAGGRAFLDTLAGEGVEVMHLQADIARAEEVRDAVRRIEQRFGRLDGIIHGAGVIADDYIVNKTAEQAARVLRPKLAGVLALDEATRHLPLKAMVLFSSIAGALGNLGQADYAGGNAFLDAFAHHRDALAARGERAGRTLSLNWPLWRDGGMRMGGQNEAMMRQATGMAAMDTAAGLRALEQALAGGHLQVLVACGDRAAMRARLLAFSYPVAAVPAGPAADGGVPPKLRQAVCAELVRIVAEVQRIQPEKIALQRDLSAYGFDSISFTEFANALNTAYGLSLMPTLFFEISDLAALADHLIAAHRPALLKASGLDAPAPAVPLPAPPPA